MERIPILRMGEFLLVTIQVDMHDRLAMTLQDDLTSRIAERERTRRAHRHLGPGDRRLVHRADDRQHLGHGPRAGCGDRASSACSRPSRSRSWSWACRLAGVRTALNVEKGMSLLRWPAGRGRSGGRRCPCRRMRRCRSDRENDVVVVRQARAEVGSGARLQPRGPDQGCHRRQRVGA